MYELQTQFLISIYFIVVLCDCNQKPKCIYIYIYLFFSLRDNLTSSSVNGSLRSNFGNFGFAPQTQFLIYIFFIVEKCDCNQKLKFIHMNLS